MTTSPSEFSEDGIEAGRKLFAGPCDFVTGAPSLETLPPAALPEVSFVGRSNVGKSSLINALTGRKTLARVSHTPGRTQHLNFFNLGNHLMLVDMPGYGFAKVAKAQSKAWNNLIRTFLRGRETLRLVVLLVDSRHGVKDSDSDVMNLLDEAGVPYRVALTKGDELKKDEAAAVMSAVAAKLKKHPAAFPEPLLTSARDNKGMAELRAIIAALA